MEWTSELAGGVGAALHEATVYGVDCEVDSAVCRVLLEVLALPETGPIDPDPRRVLILSGVSSVEVLLRRDDGRADEDPGTAVPLPTMDDVERVFASLAWSHAMYSWEFIDDTENPKDRWPDKPSLRLVLRPNPSSHSLYWFTECGIQESSDRFTSYLLEGVIVFEEASVERADGTPQSLVEFIADSERWWRAFSGRDPRLSAQAQQAAGSSAPSWRPERTQQRTTVVPGGT